MPDLTQSSRQSTSQLILVPALISLAVTIVRLSGELAHWSPGTAAAVGITWLALSWGVLGALVLVGGTALGEKLPSVSGFHSRLLYIWAVWALAGLVTLPGWPALFKVQLAYAYAARIPVVLVMLVAFQQNWATHYSAAPEDTPPGMTLWPKFLWLGFFPQLILWVGFTLASGMLVGGIVSLLGRWLTKD